MVEHKSGQRPSVVVEAAGVTSPEIPMGGGLPPWLVWLLASLVLVIVIVVAFMLLRAKPGMPEADEATKGFLLNHLISEELDHDDGTRISNSDPISGQAAWFDLKVRISKAKESGHWPTFTPLKPLKQLDKRPDVLRYEFIRDDEKGGKK